MSLRRSPRLLQKQEEEAVHQSCHVRTGTPAVHHGRISKSKFTSYSRCKGKSFTETTLDDVKDMFGGQVNQETIKVSRFESLQPSKKALNHIIKRLAVFRNITSRKTWNEAKSRKIVNAVVDPSMDDLKNKYGYEIEVEPEWDIVGNDNYGKADVAIRFDKAIVLVIEIKKDELDLGISQNLLQILAAHQQNRRRKVRMGNTMYGLASTGFESVLLRMVFDKKGDYKLTRSDAIEIPFGEPDALREQVESLAGKINWIVDSQLMLLPNS
jgi:hypothetical protein